MNAKHLIWLIPLFLFIGLGLGYTLGLESIGVLSNMMESIDKCSVQTLNYAAEHNSDCQILITGYLNNCTKRKQ